MKDEEVISISYPFFHLYSSCPSAVKSFRDCDRTCGMDGKSTPAWIRTKDQLIKSQLLYQLSYRGMRSATNRGDAAEIASLGGRATAKCVEI